VIGTVWQLRFDVPLPGRRRCLPAGLMVIVVASDEARPVIAVIGRGGNIVAHVVVNPRVLEPIGPLTAIARRVPK
jgi:hypothetical protein